MLSEEQLEALKDLRDAGIMDHGTISDCGEACNCPASNFMSKERCECGADEHNEHLNRVYDNVLKILTAKEV